MTNEQHNKYISWVFLGHAGFQLLMLLFVLAFLGVFLAIPDTGRGTPPPKALFWVMMAFMTVIYTIFTIPSVVAAYALRKKKPWARIAAIVAGAMGAMHVPFGTAACVYALWFFAGENWKEVYPEQAGLSAPPQELPGFDHAKWEGDFKTDEKGRAVFTQAEPPDWR
ncbi:MAG: hypothetical protein ACJ73D_07820 [Pyrinomonadaceae bacterium]